MKIRIYRDVQIDESGVEQVWRATCPDERCQSIGLGQITSLYWENAVRAANVHVSFHKPYEVQG